MNFRSNPFRHWIIDDFVEPVRDDDIAPVTDTVWEVRLDKKRSTTDLLCCPPLVMEAYKKVVASIHRICEELKYAIIPDAGSFQVCEAPTRFRVHLDPDRHEKLRNWRRAATVICFLSERWDGCDGGEFGLCDTRGRLVSEVKPVPGRFLMFENTDTSYHSVLPYLREKPVRAVLSVPLLAASRPHNVRELHHFLPINQVQQLSLPQEPDHA